MPRGSSRTCSSCRGTRAGPPEEDDVCEQVGEAAYHAMKPVLQSHKVAEDNPKFWENAAEGSCRVQQLKCVQHDRHQATEEKKVCSDFFLMKSDI